MFRYLAIPWLETTFLNVMYSEVMLKASFTTCRCNQTNYFRLVVGCTYLLYLLCMLKTKEKQRPMSWICNPYQVQFNVLRLCMNLAISSLHFYVDKKVSQNQNNFYLHDILQIICKK